MKITRIYPERSVYCQPANYGEAPRSAAAWVWHPHASGFDHDVLVFRCALVLERAACVRLHVSADQRFELYMDGTRVGCGPERGDLQNWFVHSYEIELPAGTHCAVARAWWIGDMTPYAQMSRRGGFFVQADGAAHALLSTGTAPWQVTRMNAYRFERSPILWGAQARQTIDARYWLPEYRTGAGGMEWYAAMPSGHTNGPVARTDIGRWWVQPATLPEMLYQPVRHVRVRHAVTRAPGDDAPLCVHAAENDPHVCAAWADLLNRAVTLTIPAHTQVRVLVDLDQYYCVYPELTVSGGAGSTVRIHWAESLYHDVPSCNKGNRNEIEGKIFHGDGDTFLPDGRLLTLDLLWWRCGRYMEVCVETAHEPLTVHALRLYETRYPLEQEHRTVCTDARTMASAPLMLRCVQMCAHETYMDCPYYEQLMYVGDTRLEVLTTYVTTGDDRLPRKALQMFDASRLPSGFTQSRYPCRVTQIIPPFSLWWICMVHDYFMWRNDMAFVRGLLPGVRAVLDGCERTRGRDGLLHPPDGWNFVDWVPGWQAGVPLGADGEPNAISNLQYVLALQAAAALEARLGRRVLASDYQQRAAALATRIRALFWNKRRGLFAYDLAQRHFSEHTQALAVISGVALDKHRASIARVLAAPNDLERTTWYFTHYLFEALALLELPAALFGRLQLWHDLVAQGFRTTPESPDPCRSDCHAWSAHPLYHYSANVLGVKPAAPGFGRVRIAPQPGTLEYVAGSVPHPRGAIHVALTNEQERLTAEITLPRGIRGEFVWRGQTRALKPGTQTILLATHKQ